MAPSPVLQFISDNPIVAFFLAWPVALVLIAVAWCSTTLVTNTFGTLFTLISQLSALILALVRGYPPKEIIVGRTNGREVSEEKEKLSQDP